MDAPVVRRASVLAIVVLAAGCTAPAPPEAGPTGEVSLVQEAEVVAFLVGSQKDPAPSPPVEAEPPPLAAPPLPPPGDPPPPETAQQPAENTSWTEGEPGPEGVPSLACQVCFAAGPDSGNGRYVSSVAIEQNATAFSAQLRVVSEATTSITQLVRLWNVAGTEQRVLLAGPHIQDPRVQGARLLAGSAMADLLTAEPTIVMSLPPGSSVDIGFEFTLGPSAPGTLPTWTVRLDVLGT